MKINTIGYTYRDSFDRDRHGSLYDRGSADNYYHRQMNPHWYPKGSYNDPRITDLTDDQIAEYKAGYEDNEESGNKKEWNWTNN